MKRVLMIIAPESFRDEELFVTKQYLEENGVKVDVASTRKGRCVGMLGGVVEAHLSIDEVSVDDYDCVVFVGGAGTPLVRRESAAIKIAQDAAAKGKVLAAICWAPTTLAKAGVLKGKNATVWAGMDSEYGMDTKRVMEKFGAHYTNEGVVEDGNVITADGPRNALKFAKAIMEKISKE